MCLFFFFLMIRRPPRSTRTDTLFPTRRSSDLLRSALDDLLSLTRLAQREKTYSSPLAIRQFVKETEIIDGRPVRDFPRLKHAGLLLDSPADHVRSEERRVGKECVSTCRSRWSPYH